MKKRVGCLYRVSTLKQVEEEDIPMQRIACREFIKLKEDWVLKKEYYEKGISGYRLRENDRDVLQDIKADVVKEEIDILLVFMFDRIGRREDETPFVVEWLIKNNIEVWSVKEGQRKIENRIDKLMNYITYWQAGGESEKTAIRVSETQEHMARKGMLTYGGINNAPYGYEFVKSGTYTKKGVERQKLIINEDEAKVVRLIYELVIKRGYGNLRIARYLNEKGILSKKGKEWGESSVNNVLKNPIYMGYPTYKKSSGKFGTSRKTQKFEDWIMPETRIEELAIISEEDWYKAREIRNSRAQANEKFIYNGRNRPFQTKSELLLIGLVKCGQCGKRFITAQNSKNDKNGQKIKYFYYKCGNIVSAKSCDLYKKRIPQKTMEEPILKIIYDYLDTIEKIDLTDEIQKTLLTSQEKEKKELNKINNNIQNKQRELKTLKEEVVKTLSGESMYPAELLNELIADKTNEINNELIKKKDLEQIIMEKELKDKDLQEFKNMVPVWKEEFEIADTELKKMLLFEIIKEIRVYNEKVEIDLRLNINESFKCIKENNISQKIIENTMIIKNRR